MKGHYMQNKHKNDTKDDKNQKKEPDLDEFDPYDIEKDEETEKQPEKEIKITNDFIAKKWIASQIGSFSLYACGLSTSFCIHNSTALYGAAGIALISNILQKKCASREEMLIEEENEKISLPKEVLKLQRFQQQYLLMTCFGLGLLGAALRHDLMPDKGVAFALGLALGSYYVYQKATDITALTLSQEVIHLSQQNDQEMIPNKAHKNDDTEIRYSGESVSSPKKICTNTPPQKSKNNSRERD